MSSRSGSVAPPESPPPCAICGRAGSRQRAPHHLTHGVTVWLCATHRSDAFQRRRNGREFVERLGAVWAASGATSARRTASLHSHLRRVRPSPSTRNRPGSYSWPRLREDAEKRFAAGESPRRVITELRRRHSRGPATVPSERTMRRWFTDARWLTRPDTACAEAFPPARSRTRIARKRSSGPPLLPDGFNSRPFFPWDELWRGSG